MTSKILDSYSLKARYYPTMVVIAPLCLVLISITSGQFDLIKNMGVFVFSGLGLTFIMDQVGRDSGRNKQPELIELWGGLPSTILLRHRDQTIERPTKERYHKTLSTLLGVDLPSIQQELDSPAFSDEIYKSCVEYLKTTTRDPIKFPLIHQENTNYGFRRNLWGMKMQGVVFSAIGTFGCIIVLAYQIYYFRDVFFVPATAVIISSALLYFWIRCVNAEWVKITAYAYARQLLSACDSSYIMNK